MVPAPPGVSGLSGSDPTVGGGGPTEPSDQGGSPLGVAARYSGNVYQQVCSVGSELRSTFAPAELPLYVLMCLWLLLCVISSVGGLILDKTVSDPNFKGMAVFTPVINGKTLTLHGTTSWTPTGSCWIEWHCFKTFIYVEPAGFEFSGCTFTAQHQSVLMLMTTVLTITRYCDDKSVLISSWTSDIFYVFRSSSQERVVGKESRSYSYHRPIFPSLFFFFLNCNKYCIW